MDRRRIKAEVTGIVQGVGFRPFVYQLAGHHDLGGFVRNTSHGALLEVEGESGRVESFLESLQSQAPPLAVITQIHVSPLPLAGHSAFSIKHSKVLPGRNTLISPDVAVCEDCLREMFDPSDRRYRYPFINCTNCGPRYTIIMDVPYDRPYTSMRDFSMCPDCAAEYDNPADRRFHAQPNACPVCGPRVELADADGVPLPADDPIQEAAERLKQGRIVAVKGLGGFHLAVDAYNGEAVARLRQRKRREEKPLAVMAPDVAAIEAFAEVSTGEAAALSSMQRPIVLLTARRPSPLAPAVAPDNKYVGAFLPYTPLHYLLLEGLRALVMTSGNLTDEPIAIDNDEAVRRLAGIADYFLLHNRDIYLRSDDSVVRVEGRGLSQIRRSRGFVPTPIFLKQGLPEVLAVGGELKNTVCLTKGDRAFISQHIGDLENLSTLEFFELTIDHLKRVLDIRPRIIAYDLHPDYLSTQWARQQTGVEIIGIQHHHAHVVGVMAEHGLDGPVIGLACDGTGYGRDGQIWGGEILLADYDRFDRRGRLEYLPLPGAAAAIREPWRMAVSALMHAYGHDLDGLDLDLLSRQDPGRLDLLKQVIEKRVGSPLTSSLGRLFDAVAALIGLRDRVAFEGQAAMMLEMLCPDGPPDPYPMDPYPVETAEAGGVWIIRPAAVIRGVVDDLREGRPGALISARFHAWTIQAFSEAAARISRETGVRTAVLSGGCFQNKILARGLFRSLEGRGLDVYTQNLAPVNDGGLSLGQAVSAGRRPA